MRRASHEISTYTFNEDDDAEAIGIKLGFDFCAEHEFGIEPLKRALGLGSSSQKGLAQFLAQPIPEGDPRLGLFIHEKATKTIPAEVRLVFSRRGGVAKEMTSALSPRMGDLPTAWIRSKEDVKKQPLVTAWGDDGFCIRAFGKEEREITLELYQGFLKGDVLLSMGGGQNPFSRAGLCISLFSKVPQHVHDAFDAAEADQEALTAAVEKTGIKDTLKRAGKGFYALEPSWASSMKTVIRSMPNGERKSDFAIKTDHPVIFFLNPQEQKQNNHGYFTVEELQDWAKGKGPIPIQPVKA